MWLCSCHWCEHYGRSCWMRSRRGLSHLYCQGENFLLCLLILLVVLLNNYLGIITQALQHWLSRFCSRNKSSSCITPSKCGWNNLLVYVMDQKTIVEINNETCMGIVGVDMVYNRIL
jgi:hypothetical protein